MAHAEQEDWDIYNSGKHGHPRKQAAQKHQQWSVANKPPVQGYGTTDKEKAGDLVVGWDKNTFGEKQRFGCK